MKRTLLGCCLLFAVLQLPLVVAPADAALRRSPATAPAPRRVHLDGVTATVSAGTHQIVTVNHTRGDRARVVLWTWHAGTGWRQALRTINGRVGYGGLVTGWKRRQGTGTTPLGTFSLISSFGRHPRAATWKLPYQQVAKGDFWVEDNGSRYYNRYRNQAQGGFRWGLGANSPNSSERLSDFPTQYEYSIVTSFNLHQVRHRGAGIFLHVNGRGATAGCVSAPRWFLARTLAILDPHWHPAIAIGR